MLQSYFVAIIGIIGLMAGWIGIQSAWRKRFPGAADEDVLARRGGCQGCHCIDICEREELPGKS